VLTVNYRGSTGFGKAFIAASEKEHARKIHDDLIDMVEWAVEQGATRQLAIFGMSYGGFASFVGATFMPEVVCCAVPVAVFRLESMPPYWAGFAENMYRSFGDPRTEEARKLLAERSPINKVENIKKPMLIFHGANDVRCKVTESDTIVAAMQAKNIPVTYIVYPDEGHGFNKPPNRISYIAIAEAFFARHLGGACEAIVEDLDGSSHEVRASADILTTWAWPDIDGRRIRSDAPPRMSLYGDVYARRREGPYRFIQNRPRTSVAALKSDAAAEKSKNRLSRDFQGCSFFDFCNNFPSVADIR
jgi:dienelactone hydrolase